MCSCSHVSSEQAPRVRALGPTLAGTLLGTLVLAGGSPAARAQAVESSAFPVERFRTAIDGSGILGAEWAEVPDHLTWDVGLWFGTSDDPLVTYMPTGERALDLVHRRVTTTATASLSLRDRLQLGLELPMIVSQHRDSQQTNTMLASISGANLGDARFIAKLALLQQRRHGLSLAVVPAFTVPTGGAEEYRGDRGITIAPELAISRSFERIRVTANAGYRNRRQSALSDLQVDDELFGRIAAGYQARPGIELDVGLATATRAADPFASANSNYAEALAGVTIDLPGAMSVGAVGGMGLASGFGSPDWRAVLTVRVDGGRSTPRVALRPHVHVPPPPSVVMTPDPEPAHSVFERQPAEPEPPLPPASEPEPEPPPVELQARVTFKHGTAVLDGSSHTALREIARILAAHSELTSIAIEGHTDDRGDAAFNMRLSQRRAEAVVRFLVSEGVAAERLTATGAGEERPAVPGATEEARAANRRVEITVAR